MEEQGLLDSLNEIDIFVCIIFICQEFSRQWQNLLINGTTMASQVDPGIVLSRSLPLIRIRVMEAAASGGMPGHEASSAGTCPENL